MGRGARGQESEGEGAGRQERDSRVGKQNGRRGRKCDRRGGQKCM